LLRSTLSIGLFLIVMGPVCGAGQDKPVASVKELEAHFATCFQAPCGEEESQATFHFALGRDGKLLGEPRIAWLKFKGSSRENRNRLTGEFLDAFKQCIPVTLSETLAETIPGRTFFLRFGIDRSEVRDAAVTLRPY
jgi:hypothetical protein